LGGFNGFFQETGGPPSFDRTQALTVNYLYNLPGGARKGTFLDNSAARLVLNGWQLSGITRISTLTKCRQQPIDISLVVIHGGRNPNAVRIDGDIDPFPLESCRKFPRVFLREGDDRRSAPGRCHGMEPKARQLAL